jgi:hypothetical protein
MNAFHQAQFWRSGGLMAAVVVMAGALAAPQPQTNGAEVQREAMKKLAFLAGRWSGPVTVARGPGEPLHLAQTEEVEYKLDGLVLLVEGRSRDAAGKAQFEALATIAYDDGTGTYRIRAYNDGHYVDTELKALADGFSWGFQAGPAQVVNTMHLNAQGQWQETTEVTVGSHPPQKSVEMLLDLQR